MGRVSTEEKCEHHSPQQIHVHSVRVDVFSLVKNYSRILQAVDAPKRNWGWGWGEKLSFKNNCTVLHL